MCDTGESPDGRPAIVAGMRGMAHFTLRIRTGDHDLHSGYGGPGSKTIIPCEAVAKVSMRLAPGQVPEECSRLVFEHLRARVQKGAELSIEEVNTGTPGFRLPTESPLFALAKDLLAKLDPRGPVFVWEGASIPVVSELARISGAAVLRLSSALRASLRRLPDCANGKMISA